MTNMLKRIGLFLSLMIASTSAQADEGGASTGGGGVIVYQAEAIKAILSDRDFIWKFTGNTAVYIKSIEYISWANGETIYRVTSDKSCTMDVKTIANETGLKYDIELGDFVCP